MFGRDTFELMHRGYYPHLLPYPMTQVSKKKNELMNRQIRECIVKKQFDSLIFSVLKQKEHMNLQVMFGFRGHHHFDNFSEWKILK